MSCRKKCFGRFAPIQMESDNCRKGADYIPIWKKDFNVSMPCLYECKEDCSNVAFKNPCDNLTTCHDDDCKNICKKAASCVLGCSNSCGKPCKYAAPCRESGHKAVDGCRLIQPRGGKLIGRFSAIEAPCGNLDYGNSPCSYLRPCHDIFKKIRTDCRGMPLCEKEAIGRFPFFKVKAEGAGCKPDREYFCFN